MTDRDDVKAAIAEVNGAIGREVIAADVSLRDFTTFRIGGPADALARVKTAEELAAVLACCRDRALPWFLLGGGSNLLIADAGFRGMVVTLSGALAATEVLDDGSAIIVGAGEKFPRLTRTALGLGWPSAVGWMGTPGQVGGALIMNAGTRDGEIGDVVDWVEAVVDGSTIVISKDDAGFSYRNSQFPRKAVLTRARLQCDDRRNDEENVLIDHAKALLRKRHASQPKQRSAGSIFKNPDGDFAGRLIEQAGLKGVQMGGAMISDVHANFIVNVGNATARDVLLLARRAQRAVKNQFDVDLRWEVRRIGDFSEVDA